MQRTSLWAVVALVVVAGVAAAGANANESTTAAYADQTFVIAFEQPGAHIEPGGSASFVLVAKTRSDQSLTIEVVRHAGDGFTAALGADSIDLKAGEPSYAKLLVTASEDAHGMGAFEVVATSASGERHAAYAKVSTERPAMGEPAKPRPAAEGAWGLRATPERQLVRPGGAADYTIVLRSSKDATIHLGIGKSAVAGWTATLSQESVDVAPGAPAKVTLHVEAPDGMDTADTDGASPNARGAAFEVYGTDGAGERHATHVKALIGDKDGPVFPKERPTPVAKPPLPARSHHVYLLVELDEGDLAPGFVERLAALGLKVHVVGADAATLMTPDSTA